MKRDSWLKTALLYSPLLVCVLVMLPRLLSPQFGFFDDAVTLTTAQKIWTGQWSIGVDPNGRFRPLYWLFYAILARLFGVHPFWFFLANLALWLAITFCLIRLALRLDLSSKAAWLAGIVFVLSGPVLENVYTLSKPELPQACLILLLLLAACFYPQLRSRLGKASLFLGMAVLAFLACCAKETGILLAPAALFSVLVAWLSSRLARPSDGKVLQQRLALWWSSLIGVVLYSSVSFLALKENPLAARSGFLQYSLEGMISQAQLLLGWLRRDYLYMLPLGLVTLLAIFRKENRKQLFLALELLGWLFLWLAIYLPWRYFPEYYLLPASLILALLAGSAFTVIQTWLAEGRVRRVAAWAGLGLAGLLLLLSLPSQVANGRLQLATDRANADMLAYIVEHAPQDETVWINIQIPNEYVTEFELWVTQVKGRSDLRVDYFHSQNLPDASAQNREVWIVSPFMENQFYPSVRVGMSELPSRQWNAALDQYLAGQGQTLDEIRQSFTSSNFDPLRIFCPLARSLSFCKIPDAPLDQRVFAYGWRVLRLP